jgi:hypothetical protein
MPDSLSSSLLAASALVIMLLGVAHLVLTFRGNKFHPRDPSLMAALKANSPVISRETTMWKAWIGFNASHSYGAILFGLVYGYLAVVHSAFLFASPYLLAVGLLALVGYVFLARSYWFSVPFRGILLATVLYVAAIFMHWA